MSRFKNACAYMLMATIDVFNFTVQVYNSIGDAPYSKSPVIRSHENLYTLVGLRPYTIHKIYMTVTNNAKSDPESFRSDMITVRTLALSKLLLN